MRADVDESAVPSMYEEIRNGSITPTSFDIREFADDISHLLNTRHLIKLQLIFPETVPLIIPITYL